MKHVLITGGSGFIGQRLIEALLKRYADVQVTSVSRSENAISQLLIRCMNPRLKLMLADIRDRDAMSCAIRGADTVIHLAAMKRVDLCEIEPAQAVATNVLGTMNMLEDFSGETFVLMSTDKAVEPVNCYGATKLIAERLTLERATKTGLDSHRRFMVLRSGNVLDSTGSVLDTWKRQIQMTNEITVTHPDMMRFYTSVEGVVRLFIAVLEYGKNGVVYSTPHGKAVILRDLIDQALKLFGNENTKIKYIGLRPGERMEEKMRSPDEMNTVSGFEEKVEAVV